MDIGFLLSEKAIRSLIEEDPDLEISEEFSGGVFVFDAQTGKDFPVRFPENLSVDLISDLIHVSSAIPPEYQLNKAILAEYLWNVCDRNAFVTLNEIVVVWDDPEQDPDPELDRLYNEYGDEFALELASGLLGQMWFDRNIVAINMREIVCTAREIAEEKADSFSPYFLFDNLAVEGLLTTAIHELRHLQMDTNIFLSDENYPFYLSSEAYVEDYCRDIYESNPILYSVLSIHKHPQRQRSLSRQIESAKAHREKGETSPSAVIFDRGADSL